MTIDHKKLRELAEAASPGEWLACTTSRPTIYVETTQQAKDGTLYGSICWVPDDEDDRLSDLARTQAIYIAAANPQTVLALLDLVDAQVACLNGLNDDVVSARMEIETLQRVQCNAASDWADTARERNSLRQQLAAAQQEVDRLQTQLTGVEAANAATDMMLVEHCELSGHIDIAAQCRDWLNALANEEGDPSGRLRDFVTSIGIVIDQLDRQRRSRNWYEVAYSAGKHKLVEHALSKVCCKGEPHTCDQEAIAAAEGRTDRSIEQLAAALAAKEEACDIAYQAIEDNAARMPTMASERIDELRLVGKEPQR